MREPFLCSRKTGEFGGQQDNCGRAQALWAGRETPYSKTEEEHGSGRIGQTHRNVSGHVVEAGAREAFPHFAHTAANRNGLWGGIGLFLHRRAQASRGLDRAPGGASAFSRKSWPGNDCLSFREPRLQSHSAEAECLLRRI